MSSLRTLVPDQYPPIPPIEADPILIDTMVEDLMACALNLDQLESFITGDTITESWKGEAADAYLTRATSTGVNAREYADGLRAGAQALAWHADDIARLRTRRTNATSDRDFFNGARTELLADIDAAGQHATDDDLDELRRRARYLATQRENFDDDVRALTTSLADADSALVTALGSITPAIAAAHRAPGRTSTDIALDALNQTGSPTRGGTIADITAWWNALTPAQQDALTATHPALIGNADGIPIAARDRANRLHLAANLAALEWQEQDGDLDGIETQALANARAVRDALAWGATQTDPGSGSTMEPLLYVYDATAFDGDGTAGIAFGNPDVADNVSVLVPGLHSRADSALRYTDNAYSVYASARLSDPGATVSSMMWIGYDAPSDSDMNTVVAESRAAAGGAALSRFIDALRSTDQGTPAHITVIGHSYGSTTVAHGAADAGLDIDDLVLVGSPGAGGGTTHATQLGLPSSHVWVGRNSRDPVTYLGTEGAIGMSTLAGLGLGHNPADEDFGANRFQAEAIDRGATPSFDDHVKYFETDSESLHNIGAIIAATYSDVESAQPSFDRWYAFPVDPEAVREPGDYSDTRESGDHQ